MNARRREQLPPDLRWFCDFCSAEQWNEPILYGVPLCMLCIQKAADNPTKVYHTQCRLYVAEKELAEATRTIECLRAKIEELKDER